jgi:hypothetical protein
MAGPGVLPGLGDAVAQVVADAREAGPLGRVGPQERAADAAVLGDAAGPVGAAAVAERDPAALEMAEELLPPGVRGVRYSWLGAKGPAAGDECPVAVDDFLGVDGLVSHPGVDVAVAGHELGDVRRHPVHDRNHQGTEFPVPRIRVMMALSTSASSGLMTSSRSVSVLDGVIRSSGISSPAAGSRYWMRLWWDSSVSSSMRIPECRRTSTAAQAQNPRSSFEGEVAALPGAGLVSPDCCLLPAAEHWDGRTADETAADLEVANADHTLAKTALQAAGNAVGTAATALANARIGRSGAAGHRQIPRGLRGHPQSLHCLFVMEAGSRHVHIPGITANPDGPRTAQQIRSRLMEPGDRAAAFRFLVRDRAGQFTSAFDAVLADAGIEVVKIPPRSPKASAYAERFVLAARKEVTDRMLVFGERHLWTILARYQALYNGQRPHRSRQLGPPRSDHRVADLSRMRIQRRPVLGGLISEYERAA